MTLEKGDMVTCKDSTQVVRKKVSQSTRKESGIKGYTYANCRQCNFSWDFQNLDYHIIK